MRLGTLCAAFVAAVATTATAAVAPVVPSGSAAPATPLAGLTGPPAGAEAFAPGTIRGRVVLRPPPARRTPGRYPGAGSAPGRRVQDIPAVAFVRGPADGPALPGDRRVMAQSDTAFSPSAIAVTVGTEVEFPNQDGFFHNVFSYSEPQRFDLGRYPEGETKAVRFDRPGVVRVYCEVHETMRAAIVVTESPHHAVVGEDGVFVLEGVPAGRHTVEVWHADLGSAEATLVVPSGGTVSVELTLG